MPLEWKPLSTTFACFSSTSLNIFSVFSFLKFGYCNFLAWNSELVIYLLEASGLLLLLFFLLFIFSLPFVKGRFSYPVRWLQGKKPGQSMCKVPTWWLAHHKYSVNMTSLASPLGPHCEICGWRAVKFKTDDNLSMLLYGCRWVRRKNVRLKKNRRIGPQNVQKIECF